jgi:hypothetical protein
MSMVQYVLNVRVNVDDIKICEPCMYGKAHRMPFGTRKSAEKPGELFFPYVPESSCEYHLI